MCFNSIPRVPISPAKLVSGHSFRLTHQVQRVRVPCPISATNLGSNSRPLYTKHSGPKCNETRRAPYVADLGLKITPVNLRSRIISPQWTTWLPEFSSKAVQPTSPTSAMEQRGTPDIHPVSGAKKTKLIDPSRKILKRLQTLFYFLVFGSCRIRHTGRSDGPNLTVASKLWSSLGGCRRLAPVVDSNSLSPTLCINFFRGPACRAVLLSRRVLP